MNLYEMTLSDNTVAIIHDTETHKTLMSTNYNFIFDKVTGKHARWGNTIKHDGALHLGVPEIADIEISTICNGVKGVICPFCYKKNSPTGHNMSLFTFMSLFNKLPPSITQVALGIGDIESNPEFWHILDYTRGRGVVPNITTNGEGMTPQIARKLSKVCGAVAVSLYNPATTYDAVKMLTDAGLDQVNIHFLLSSETYEKALDLYCDYKNDTRLEGLRAIVLLSLKQKGRAVDTFSRLSQDKLNYLVHLAFVQDIPLGFDSCGAVKFMEAVKDYPNKDQLESLCEPCESSLYSSYFDVHGKYYPCSFMEGTPDWEEGLEVIECNDFMRDVWLHERTQSFRVSTSINRITGKACTQYKI